MSVPWSEIVTHRERLLRLARRRVPTLEDAEDVVQEAMIRSATFADLDEARVGQFLTAVTMRLCADLHRRADRGARAVRRLQTDDVPSPEAAAVAAAEAEELRALLDSLPERQRDVLVDRAEGLSVTQISTRHRLTYKATESALSRARSTMRLALAAAMSVAAAGFAALRRRPAVATLTAAPFVAVALVTTVHHAPEQHAAPAVEMPAPASDAMRTRPGAYTGLTAAAPATATRVTAPRLRTAAVVVAAPAPAKDEYRDVVRYDPPGDTIPDLVIKENGESANAMVERCAKAESYSVTIQPPDAPGPAIDVYCNPPKP